jgi:hypothetical protein
MIILAGLAKKRILVDLTARDPPEFAFIYFRHRGNQRNLPQTPRP